MNQEAIQVLKGYKYYYNDFKYLGVLKMFIDSFKKKSYQKLSILYRMMDYFNVRKSKSLFILHREIYNILYEGLREYEGYDYGEGYFYQSCSEVNIRGFRNTEERFALMNLADFLRDKNVLEIGCNTGFISLKASKYAKSCHAFDIAPYLIKIARKVSNYLNIKNCNFDITSFEDFSSNFKYDVVLSFANHHTFDNNTKYSLKKFFEKCYNLLNKKGILLFESHHPGFETKHELENVIEIIKEYFNIIKMKILPYKKSLMDKGRTFIVLEKK